jgi:AcrR family transcriptional regulator
MSRNAAEFVHVLWTSKTHSDAARRLGISRTTFYNRLRSTAVQRMIEEISQAQQALLTLRSAELYDTALQSLADLAQHAEDPQVRIEACRELIKHCRLRDVWEISE